MGENKVVSNEAAGDSTYGFKVSRIIQAGEPRVNPVEW
jgi:hypothetical protein